MRNFLLLIALFIAAAYGYWYFTLEKAPPPPPPSTPVPVVATPRLKPAVDAHWKSPLDAPSGLNPRGTNPAPRAGDKLDWPPHH